MSEQFVSLGLGRYVRADRVLGLEPIEGEDRGPGHRTRVWVDGLAAPMIASRGEQAILADLEGVTAAADRPGRTTGSRRRDEPPSLF